MKIHLFLFSLLLAVISAIARGHEEAVPTTQLRSTNRDLTGSSLSPFYIYRKGQYYPWCLTWSDSGGQVYVSSCKANNLYQKWFYYHGYIVPYYYFGKNYNTVEYYCLFYDKKYDLKTGKCKNKKQYYWTYFDYHFGSLNDWLCIDHCRSCNHKGTVKKCIKEAGNDLHAYEDQLWYVGDKFWWWWY